MTLVFLLVCGGNEPEDYDPFGPDRDCGDFETEAQAFLIAAGGPGGDPHRLTGMETGGLVKFCHEEICSVPHFVSVLANTGTRFPGPGVCNFSKFCQ